MNKTRLPRARAQAHRQSAAFLALPALLALSALVLFIAAAKAQTVKSERETFKVIAIAGGLENPWGVAFLPNGDLLVTEREGRLRLISGGKLVKEPIAGVPKAAVGGQGGLLDVVLHPKFAENGLVYLSYAARGENGSNTEVARGRLNGMALENVEVIFRAAPKSPGSAHFGGRMAFTAQGDLILTLGDKYSMKDEAQNLGNHFGKIVLIRDGGGAVPGAPFADKPGAKPDILSYGHRNVQGLAIRPGSGQIWTHEHGPRGGDEVNVIRAGANYGWPKITYGVDYSGAIISDKTEAPGMEQPVIYWKPSIAPSGMTFYDGDKFPNWRGNIFVGALAGQHLRRLTLDGDKVTGQETLLADLRERIRDVRQGPDGYLYLLTDDPSDGRVLRLEPAQ